MILVGDSSALIALAICDRLDLLSEFYSEIYVPEAVYGEVGKEEKVEGQKLRNYLQDKVRKVDMSDYVYLDALADYGEAEAMVLYKHISADKLLIDDKKARRIASMNDIDVVGSLGVLLKAKKAGLIPDVASSLDKLKRSRIFISNTLINTVLELAGECE